MAPLRGAIRNDILTSVEQYCGDNRYQYVKGDETKDKDQSKNSVRIQLFCEADEITSHSSDNRNLSVD